MAFDALTISTNTMGFIDARTRPKVVFLPEASTNSGRLLMVKDYFGAASLSTITVSTTGTSLIDDVNTSYQITNIFGSMTFLSDGLRSWRTLGLYTGGNTPLAMIPRTVPLLQLWFDATDINGNGSASLDGALINTWVDKSGRGRNATSTRTQATVFLNGLNGQPVVNVVALSAYTVPYSVITQRYTIFCVAFTRLTTFQPVVFSNLYVRFGATSGFVATSSGNGSGWNDTAANTPNISNQNVWRIICMRIQGNGASLNAPFVDGTAQTAKTASLGGWSSMLLFQGGVTDLFNGQCAEILLYSEALTVAERQTIEGYLAWKWGLVANLPSTHPYKNSPP